VTEDDIEVEIAARSVERKQVAEWHPRVVERLNNADRNDRVETIKRLHISDKNETFWGETGAFYAFLKELDRLKGSVSTNRIDYFQHKIARRLADKLENIR